MSLFYHLVDSTSKCKFQHLFVKALYGIRMASLKRCIKPNLAVFNLVTQEVLNYKIFKIFVVNTFTYFKYYS